MSPSGLFADVLLPLPLPQTFTYAVPEALSASLTSGCRVVVPFGSRKLYTGIVHSLHHTQPEYKVKTIDSLAGEGSIVDSKQLKFWNWLASYYLCTPGEVMKAALPSGLKLESETLVALDSRYEGDLILKGREEAVFLALSSGREMALEKLSAVTGIGNVLPVVQLLMEKGVLVVSEGMRRASGIKTQACIFLSEPYAGNLELLKPVLDDLSRAKKQADLLMTFLRISEDKASHVAKKELLVEAGVSEAVLQALIAKKILEVRNLPCDAFKSSDTAMHGFSVLSKKQEEALQAIRSSFTKQPVCLLHGLTSSGKTEIYIHLIEECIRSGRQALYLVPEIALTTQLSERLMRVFGSKLGVYHSKFPDGERVQLWRKMLRSDHCQVVLGVRSSLFLPFENLGLIIVDEEHESSFKQQDPAPRYHARNAAMVLASMHKAKTLLGSATPSLESYYHAKTGKYGLVELFARHFDMPLPYIEAVNTRELRRKKIMKSILSPPLIERMRETLSERGQIILFQNRRGYAPVLECADCAWIPKCERCDVTLTLHKSHRKLTCHYCGYERDIPATCPSCGGASLTTHGSGTEQIEEEVKRLFPEARTSRMDTDTTRSRRSYEQIIHDFEEGKTDVLIGTQMVSKGLDFERVRVVGILQADQMLNYPDFRAHERSFQMMAQVSGRAGRKGRRGLVILQTTDPAQPVIQNVMKTDFEGFCQREMEQRKMFFYPPFSRLIQIRFRHRDPITVRQAAQAYASLVRPYFGSMLLGPDQPPIGRINNFYHQQLLLKLAPDLSSVKVREILLKGWDLLKQEAPFKSIQVSFDVDPM